MKTYVLTLFLVVFLLAVLMSGTARGEVIVNLKNGRTVTGIIQEEGDEFIRVNTDMGEIKIDRKNVDSIQEAPFAQLQKPISDTTRMNDQVVVHLKNETLVDGFLIAKSKTMIMLQSEMGRLTIPKQDVLKIEYVSSPFAEKGEFVQLELTTGKKISGYLESEDHSSITLTTEMGKLTIDKDNLRSLRYDVAAKFKVKDAEKGYEFGTAKAEKETDLERQQDAFGIGFSSSFGEDYDRGLIFSYRRRQQLQRLKSMSINAELGLDLPFYGINEDIYEDTGLPGSASVEGYALVPTLSASLPIFLYSSLGQSYRFFIAPQVDFLLVNKSLEITYPSFPDLDEKTSSTDFRFGVSAHLGMEWDVAKNWTIAISYKPHLVFNDENYSSTFLYVGTKLY